MFQSSASRLRSWWSAATEDLLGGDLPEPARPPVDFHRSHPHRRPLARSSSRRPGMVPARPAHCLSPVRPKRDPAHLPQPTSGS